jgi:hypothetical protein
VSPERAALAARARVLSPRGSTGHAIPSNVRGAPPGRGDGHNH